MGQQSTAYKLAMGELDWTSLVGGAAGAKFLDFVFSYLKEKRKAKTNASDSIRATVEIYKALQRIPDHQCLRRSVFKAHNGGKALDTRTHKYVTMLYEDVRHPFESIIDDIQAWRMDESYAKILAKVVLEKKAHVYPLDLPESSKLRTLYESQDVHYSYLAYLGEDGQSLYYASFATNQAIPQFDVDTRAGINNSVDRITNLLKL